MLVVIDNYDSFVYNLVQQFRILEDEVKVFRNDEVSIDRIRELKPDHILISPGPKTPNEAGISLELIRELGPTVPILGVCLGHQAIALAFGAKLKRSKAVCHGKTSELHHDGKSIFTGLDAPMIVGRYHSLEVEPDSLPPELEVSAWSEDGTIMGLRHKEYRVEGVQFHPESVLTPQGRRLCENFLSGGRPRTTIRKSIATVIEGGDLSRSEAEDVMGQILAGEATSAQIASLVTALRFKGETVGEVAGFARTMRKFSRKLAVPEGPIIDTCGTGGDGAGTFNISTVSAIVSAGAGCRVAKHGNRSVSSKCGSADVLEELGVNIACDQEKMERALVEAGIAFIFAPIYHGAMKHAMGPRKEIGIRTVFNMLGPLTNPAGAKRQLLGVYDPKLTEMFASVLAELGSEQAMVVHGSDGLDEITLTGKTSVSELKNGTIKTYELHPEDFGLTVCKPEDLAGSSANRNARITGEILDCAPGPRRDIVVLNAAASIMVCGKCENLSEGIRLAQESIDSGKAKRALARLAEISHGG